MPVDLATQALIERLHQLGPAGRSQLDDDDLALIDDVFQAAKYEEIDALCRREEASFDSGPLLYLTRFTKTENPQYEEQGLPFLAGFPKKSYFIPLFQTFLARHDMIAICKSRTMMTTWAAAGFACWSAQWKNEQTVVQTANIDRAARVIDYVRQLLDHQDPGLAALHPLAKRTVFGVTWKSGGEVTAVPGGADAARGFHPTWFIQDESSIVEGGQAAIDSVLPSRAKVICISTARAGWFGEMCEGASKSFTTSCASAFRPVKP